MPLSAVGGGGLAGGPGGGGLRCAPPPPNIDPLLPLQSEPRMRLLVAQHMLRDIQGILNRLEVSGTPLTPP